jgi:DNA-binding NarL/FixJ family response regulator
LLPRNDLIGGSWNDGDTVGNQPKTAGFDVGRVGEYMGPFRVLVVEDFAPFRRLICTMLDSSPNVQVIGEVADGMEAVRLAEELQPHLILLDIGLPTLNGIEAARQIRKLSPESKILFVSHESSPQLVNEAFRIGAQGYVVKALADSELLDAVETVLLGKQFASRGLPSS